MNFIKLFCIGFLLLVAFGLVNRGRQVYSCYSVVMEDPNHSRQPVKHVLDCMDSVMTRGHIPCYYKGCK